MWLIVLHDGAALAPHEFWSVWAWEPLPAVAIAFTGLAYLIGLLRLWREAGHGRSVAPWRAGVFAAGLLVLAFSLLSPLDPLGEALFAAHMVQHLLLMLVAPLLLVLGAPSRVFLWALPPGRRRSLAVWWNRRGALHRVVGALLEPAVAWTLSVLALLLWHVPGWYQAALGNGAIHAAEHISFLLTGFLFWWVVLRPDGYRRLNYAVSVLYLFTAAIPSGLLGALLTFAGRPLYPAQSSAAALWGLSRLEDQQLAGLIMWMPGGLVYLAGAATFFLIWLGNEERKTMRAVLAIGVE